MRKPTNYFAEVLRQQAIIQGREEGFNEQADILVQSADGTNLLEIWTEIQQLLSLYNQQRNPLISFLTFRVSSPIDIVGVPSETDFEEASEYGQPVGMKGFSSFNRGYTFKFYDLAARYTWMFLASATAQQIRNQTNMALEADNRLQFNKVLQTLFNPSNLLGVADNNIPTTVYKFYNGDGEVPPSWKNYTFSGTHSHYQTSKTLADTATLTPDVLDALEEDFIQHGYSTQNGTNLLLMVNRQEGAIIRTWRVASGGRYDFIPGAGYGGAVLMPANSGIVAAPSGTIKGEIGTYGPFHIVEEDYQPAGYLSLFGSGGPDNLNNPIGIREHSNPAYRGLKLIPGQRSDYPLTDSFFRRGFGVGIRQRGAGFIVQISGAANYTVPAQYA
ncbi:hypothetical protein ACWIG4_30155 [Streptomyces sp. NPDC002248]